MAYEPHYTIHIKIALAEGAERTPYHLVFAQRPRVYVFVITFLSYSVTSWRSAQSMQLAAETLG